MGQRYNQRSVNVTETIGCVTSEHQPGEDTSVCVWHLNNIGTLFIAGAKDSYVRHFVLSLYYIGLDLLLLIPVLKFCVHSKFILKRY